MPMLNIMTLLLDNFNITLVFRICKCNLSQYDVFFITIAFMYYNVACVSESKQALKIHVQWLLKGRGRPRFLPPGKIGGV